MDLLLNSSFRMIFSNRNVPQQFLNPIITVNIQSGSFMARLKSTSGLHPSLGTTGASLGTFRWAV